MTAPGLKKIKMTEASAPLKDYAGQLGGLPLIVTSRGKPVAALVPIEGVDLESLSLSTNPDFIELIERSRRDFKEKRVIPVEEMWRRLGLDK